MTHQQPLRATSKVIFIINKQKVKERANMDPGPVQKQNDTRCSRVGDTRQVKREAKAIRFPNSSLVPDHFFISESVKNEQRIFTLPELMRNLYLGLASLVSIGCGSSFYQATKHFAQ